MFSPKAADKRVRVLFEAISSSSCKNVLVLIVEMDSKAQARIMLVSALDLLDSYFLFE